jgi:isopentenyl phosphate kinase
MDHVRVLNVGSLQDVRVYPIHGQLANPERVRTLVAYIRKELGRSRAPVLNSIVLARYQTMTVIISGDDVFAALCELGNPLPNFPCLEYVFSSMDDVAEAYTRLNFGH